MGKFKPKLIKQEVIEIDAIIKGSLNHDHDHHSGWCKELWNKNLKF